MAIIPTSLGANAIGAVKGLTARHAYIQDYNTKHTINRIDASIREVHSIESTPSKFPIETGQAVTDNFVVEPASLDMEGIITDNPINPSDTAATTLISAIVPPSGIVSGGVAVAVFNALNDPNNIHSPSVQNFNQLVQLVINKSRINVYTTLKFYKSMWLSSLKVTREAKSGASLEFSAHFVQIILVAPYTVNTGQYLTQNSAPQANRGKINSEYSNVTNAGSVAGYTKGFSLTAPSSNVAAGAGTP